MGFEGRFTGVKAANGIAMMFGIHGGKKISGGFVLGLGLLAAPMHAETVAEAAEHSDHAHGAGLAHAALIIPMGDIQPQVQPVFDAPGRSVFFNHWVALSSWGRRLVISATVSGR